MLPPHSTEWPTGHSDPWQAPQPPGGVAPLRHDLALARYLEKRAAYRTMRVYQPDLWALLFRRCAVMVRNVVDLIVAAARATAP